MDENEYEYENVLFEKALANLSMSPDRLMDQADLDKVFIEVERIREEDECSLNQMFA